VEKVRLLFSSSPTFVCFNAARQGQGRVERERDSAKPLRNACSLK